MNDKTKAKIEALAEAMAEKKAFLSWGDKTEPPLYDQDLWENAIESAEPWAKWCERFEEAIDEHLSQYSKVDLVRQRELEEILGEYQEWLEDRDEEL